MYTVGCLFYAIYFFVSFPMFYRIDEEAKKAKWSLQAVALDRCVFGGTARSKQNGLPLLCILLRLTPRVLLFMWRPNLGGRAQAFVQGPCVARRRQIVSLGGVELGRPTASHSSSHVLATAPMFAAHSSPDSKHPMPATTTLCRTPLSLTSFFCRTYSLAAGMLVTILLDLWRISIGGIVDSGAPGGKSGLPWMK